ncbi:MAG: S8 family serine peptidase [Rhabdochlamydiaceae bacterium]|nr:S8 family serine peptidase [Rhabdochlamydiaceae bacterium]
MSSLTRTGLSRMGSWERVYWTKGTAAAESYCARKSSGWEWAERAAQYLLELNEQTTRLPRLKRQLKKLKTDYFNKKASYQREALDPDCKSITAFYQRGLPGRTPFHIPSFRKRFQTIESLNEHVVWKIALHKRCSKVITTVQKRLTLSPALSADLKELRRYHFRALRKWSALSISRSELLPMPRGNPYELMKINAMQASGYLGARADATIFYEEMIDHTHNAIKDIYLTRELVDPAVDPGSNLHGTHVCGIIAGTAPLGKIFSAGCKVDPKWQRPLRGIINWSGCFLMKEAADPSAWYSTYFSDKEDKLVIQSCGNEGVVLDRNAFEYNTIVNPVLSDPSRSASWIFVVNLQQNGLYPNPFSNLPGKSCAERAICAIGTDIYSTIPGNQFTTMSGTSMAAPFVTGVAMMIQGAFPFLGMDEIRYAILQGATPIIIDCYGVPHQIERRHLASYPEEQIARSREVFGMGLLNAEGALSIASELSRMKDQIKKEAQDLFERVWGPNKA